MVRINTNNSPLRGRRHCARSSDANRVTVKLGKSSTVPHHARGHILDQIARTRTVFCVTTDELVAVIVSAQQKSPRGEELKKRTWPRLDEVSSVRTRLFRASHQPRRAHYDACSGVPLKAYGRRAFCTPAAA